MFDRPKIDIEIVKGRLKPEEFNKAQNYIKGLVNKFESDYDKALESATCKEKAVDVIDNALYQMYEIMKESSSFMSRFPKKDIVGLMKRFIPENLEEELEDLF